MSTQFKAHSVERDLKITAGLCLTLISALFWAAVYFSGISSKVAITLYLALMLICVPLCVNLYRRIVTPLDSLVNVVEAIRLEDYGFSVRNSYRTGVMAHLLNETAALESCLQQRKDRYAQHVYLIYRLIEQLDSPVLVFDQDARLSHANGAFSKWFGQAWQSVRGLSSHKLGFTLRDDTEWQFVDKARHSGWQIKQSRFLDHDDQFQLLILNDIEQEVRQVQQDSWQQIIRVLSHEIRNSLTPINAMAQLLLDAPNQPANHLEPLQVIQSRSKSLQTFVDRYANTSRTFTLAPCQLSVQALMSKITPLFSDMKFDLTIHQDKFYADPVLLEQVLINLLQNANEAQQLIGNQDPVKVTFSMAQQQFHISVKDKGQGIANPANLFVPFYTTKPEGQGIGLVFCRNVIEQHGGKLQLQNRTDGGAEAIISLPPAIVSNRD